MPGYEITEELAGLLAFGVATGVSWALTSLRRATNQITDLKEELETSRRIIEASSSSCSSPDEKQNQNVLSSFSSQITESAATAVMSPTIQSTAASQETFFLTPMTPPLNDHNTIYNHTINNTIYNNNHNMDDDITTVTDEPAINPKPISPSVLLSPPRSPPHHSHIDTSEDFDDSTVFSSPMPTTTLFHHHHNNNNLLTTPPRDHNQEDDANLSRFYTFSTPQSAPPVTPNLTPITVHHSHHNHDHTNHTNTHVSHSHVPTAQQPSVTNKRSGTPTSVKSNGSNSTTPIRRLRSETPISKHRSTMVLKGHTSMIQSITVCTDEKHIVSASLDRTLKIWQLSTGHCVKTLRGHTGGIYCVATLPLSQTSSFTTSNSTSMSPLSSVSPPSQTTHTSQNPQSTPSSSIMTQKILSGGDDNTIKLWEPASGRCLQTWRGHSDTVSCMLVLSQQQSFASSNNDASSESNHADLLDNYVNRKYHSNKLNTNNNNHASVCWLVSGSWDKTLRVWDASQTSGATTAACLGVLTGHTRQIQCLSLVSVINKSITITIDNNNSNHKKVRGWRIVSGSWDRSLRVWDLCFQTNNSNGSNVSLSYDCVAVLSGHSDYVLCVTALTVPHSFFHPIEKTNDNTSTADSNNKDISVLVSGSIDRTIRFWRLDLLPENDHIQQSHAVEATTSSTKISSTNRHLTPTNNKQTKSVVTARSTPTRRSSTTATNNVHLHSYSSSNQSVTGHHLNNVCFYIYREPNAAIYCLSPYVTHNNSHNNMVYFVSGSFYRTLTLWSLTNGDHFVNCQDMQQQHVTNHSRVKSQRWKSPIAVSVTRQSMLLSPVRAQPPPTRAPSNVNNEDGHSDIVTITAGALHHHNLQHQTSTVHNNINNHSTNTSTIANSTHNNMNMSLEAVRLCEGHKGTASCVVILSDGRVISGSRDETLLVWSPLC